MTYSIIARCQRSKQLGVASATYSIACGRRNESIRANIGISKSQAFYLRQADIIALNMLEIGHSPNYIMSKLEEADPDFSFRQLGIIDMDGNITVHTGSDTKGWSGHKIGNDFAVYGNVLKGPETIESMANSLSQTSDSSDRPLGERLLMALECGRNAGGQAMDGKPIPERSAWLRVVGNSAWPELDLRVDLHVDAIVELRRLYDKLLVSEQLLTN